MAGGFLFLGIILGVVFLMATVLIIYYKQVSEGYEDQFHSGQGFRHGEALGLSNLMPLADADALEGQFRAKAGGKLNEEEMALVDAWSDASINENFFDGTGDWEYWRVESRAEMAVDQSRGEAGRTRQPLPAGGRGRRCR